MNLMAGSLGGAIPTLRTDGPSVISICVNAVCPLKCRHCYLAGGEPAIGVGAAQWLRFLRSVFIDLRPHSLCFSGKEVFALDESASLFFDALRLREEEQAGSVQRTRIGVITNGTLLDRYRDQLVECPPDWLDISIDGLERTHDEVRGPGAFCRVANNLPWLMESLGDRLWIAVTLMESNVQELPSIVSGMHKAFGLKHFTLGIYKPLSYTDSTLQLVEPGRDSRILRSLHALGEIEDADGVVVRLELDAVDAGLRLGLEEAGHVPAAGAIRVAAHSLKNGVTLRFAAASLPVGLWRAVRVTNEGLYLAAEDLMDVTAYRRRAIGHIADFDYDAKRAYAAGLAHPRFRELVGTDAPEFLARLARSA